MNLFKKSVPLPDWESEGGLTIADALAQVLIAYGPGGFVQVRIRSGVETISAPADRPAARKELDTRGKFGEFYQEKDYPSLTVGEFRAMQDQRHVEYDAWYKREHELIAIAYPFEYVVGRGNDSMSYRFGSMVDGRTWEEALDNAHILGATTRQRSMF